MKLVLKILLSITLLMMFARFAKISNINLFFKSVHTIKIVVFLHIVIKTHTIEIVDSKSVVFIPECY